MGWSTYFAFIFAAVNTLTVTYFLAVERYPFLNEIFPTFIHYVVIIGLIAIPLLILIGYAHFKRSAAFRSEADISFEVNPYFRRILMNTELMIPFHLKITELLIKLSKNEKLTQSELNEISELQIDLKEHLEIDDSKSKSNSNLGKSSFSKLKKMDEK